MDQFNWLMFTLALHFIESSLIKDCSLMLTDWFARKNVDDTVIFVAIFITGTKQVRSITDEFVPLQSGSVFYEHAKLTGAQSPGQHSNIRCAQRRCCCSGLCWDIFNCYYHLYLQVNLHCMIVQHFVTIVSFGSLKVLVEFALTAYTD